MPIVQTRLALDTEPREIKEITQGIAGWVAEQGIGIGLLTIYIPHTSASLLIQENGSPEECGLLMSELNDFLNQSRL